MTWIESLYWSFHDYTYIWYACMFVAIVVPYFFWRRSRKPKIKPVTMVSEFDKSGLVTPYQIDSEQEGASFIVFERANGDLENKRIGQPFTLILDDENIERQHFNPKGAHACLDPAKLMADYKFDIKEKNVVVAETEQHIRELRTGQYATDKPSKHLRMFFLIFILASCIGIGFAAVF